MHPYLKKTLRITLRVVIGFAGFVALYLLSAYVLARIPVSGKAQGDDVTIYLLTNGVHTDFVVPARHPLKDWTKDVPYAHTRSNDSTQAYLGMGWGDKGFYLETPTWAELKPSVAFKAATGLSTTAIHATYHASVRLGDSCRQITISRDQYQKLINYISGTFQRDASGNVRHIATNAVYGDTDAFYEAYGRYNIFQTCNEWVNDGLEACGLKSCVWTPFNTGLFLMYPE
jgi:uncharacterized protein (TIGR02117 family)